MLLESTPDLVYLAYWPGLVFALRVSGPPLDWGPRSAALDSSSPVPRLVNPVRLVNECQTDTPHLPPKRKGSTLRPPDSSSKHN